MLYGTLSNCQGMPWNIYLYYTAIGIIKTRSPHRSHLNIFHQERQRDFRPNNSHNRHYNLNNSLNERAGGWNWVCDKTTFLLLCASLSFVIMAVGHAFSAVPVSVFSEVLICSLNFTWRQFKAHNLVAYLSKYITNHQWDKAGFLKVEDFPKTYDRIQVPQSKDKIF